MRKFFASLFDKSKQEKVQVVDPKKILFSVPTLSDDIAPLVPLSESPAVRILVSMKMNGVKLNSSPKVNYRSFNS